MARQSFPGDPASASAPPAAWALLPEFRAQKAAPFPPPPRRRNTPRSSQLGPTECAKKNSLLLHTVFLRFRRIASYVVIATPVPSREPASSDLYLKVLYHS